MEEKQKSSTQNELQENIQEPLPLAVQDKQENITESKPQTEPSAANTDSIQKETVNVIVKMPQENNRIVNGITIFSAVINLILAVLTYFLWKEAVRASQTATESLQETRRAVNESVRSNTIAENNYKLAKESFDSSISSGKESSEIAKKSTDLQSQSVMAQIKSLEETQKRFEIENEPYLQIIDPDVTYSNETNSAYINYGITNMKEVPIKIISQRTNVLIDGVIQPEMNELKDFSTSPNTQLNTYITKGVTQGKTATLPFSYMNSSISILDQPNIYIYFYTEIIYQNFINRKKRIYKYGIKLKHVNSSVGTYRDIIYNENVDL